MKHSLLSLSGLLLAITVVAQPEFTRNDMFPVGFSYQKIRVNNPSGISTAATGANSTWNYSSAAGDVASESADAIAGQPFSGSFPNSTFVMAGKQGNDSLYNYFKVSANSYALDGYYRFPDESFPPPPGSNGPMIYNPPVDIFRFPSMMGSTFNQEIAGVKRTSLDSVSRKGQQTVTFDGYGTLTTPAGTFQNALRYYTEQAYKDSSAAEGITIAYTVKSWSWISAATRGVILLHKEIMTTGNNPVPDTTAWYTNPGDVGISENNKQSFTIYPNPMQEIFSLSGKAEPGNMTVDLLSVTGQQVQRLYTGNLNGQLFNLQLSLKNVEPGFYIVNLNNGEKQESYPVVVK
jgi:hypothetical protein